jgi:hypothetical protein
MAMLYKYGGEQNRCGAEPQGVKTSIETKRLETWRDASDKRAHASARRRPVESEPPAIGTT